MKNRMHVSTNLIESMVLEKFARAMCMFVTNSGMKIFFLDVFDDAAAVSAANLLFCKILSIVSILYDIIFYISLSTIVVAVDAFFFFFFFLL